MNSFQSEKTIVQVSAVPDTLRGHPHYAGEISKRRFISTIRHENASFQKRSSNQRNLKTPVLRFCLEEKRFAKRYNRKRWRHENHAISLTNFSSNTNPKSRMIIAFSKFIWRSAEAGSKINVFEPFMSFPNKVVVAST